MDAKETGGETSGSYAFALYRKGVKHTIVVWNGVKDYERLPDPQNLTHINMGGLVFGANVFIAQIRDDKRNDIMLSYVDTVLESNDSVILWARNTKTYNSLRDLFRLLATRKRDGSPLTKN